MSEVKNTAEDQGRRKGLIISVSDYGDKDLHQLQFCRNDGEEMYKVLKSLGYEIPDNYKLIGTVKYDEMRNAIRKFFKDKTNNWNDTLLFYFSGHGISDGSGETFLSTSEIDSSEPDEYGFSFDELTKMMGKSTSRRIVTVLDCCYSGRARVVKGGNEKTIARKARETMLESYEQKKNQGYDLGEGKCLMASSLAHQESLMLKKLNHSLFTYYLLEGLRGGNGQSVDEEGYVTPNSLGDYIVDQIMSSPSDERPDQRPIIKTETSGKFILAEHRGLAKRRPTLESVNPSSETFYSKINKGDRAAKNKDYVRAMRFYDEAIAIDPNNHLPYISKGDVFSEMGKNTEAIEAYEGAIISRPNDPEAYDLVGDVYLRLKAYEQALESYDQALKIEPESSEYLKDKGLALMGVRDYTNAITLFNTALNANPDNIMAQKYKGDVLFLLQNYKDSIVCFDKVLDVDPNDVDALNRKGMALALMKKPDLAIESFQKALQVDPTFTQAKENLENTRAQEIQVSQVRSQQQERIEGDTGRTPHEIRKYYKRSHAIIIGISHYKEECVLLNAYNNAAAIGRVLKEKYDFDNVITLFNEEATGDKIREILQDMLRDESIIGIQDRVLIYYSGYGKLRRSVNWKGEETNTGYIIPYDSRSKRYSTSIEMDVLVKSCQGCNAKHILLILDCCYDGSFVATRDAEPKVPPKNIDENFLRGITQRKAIQVLAATQQDEPANDSGILPGFSAFTGALLEILKNEKDPIPNGVITASEIGTVLQQEVVHQKGVFQRPFYNIIAGSEGGDFIFKVLPEPQRNA